MAVSPANTKLLVSQATALASEMEAELLCENFFQVSRGDVQLGFTGDVDVMPESWQLCCEQNNEGQSQKKVEQRTRGLDS